MICRILHNASWLLILLCSFRLRGSKHFAGILSIRVASAASGSVIFFWVGWLPVFATDQLGPVRSSKGKRTVNKARFEWRVSVTHLRTDADPLQVQIPIQIQSDCNDSSAILAMPLCAINIITPIWRARTSSITEKVLCQYAWVTVGLVMQLLL